MNLKPLILDVETPIFNDGNPFTPSNRLQCVGARNTDRLLVHSIEHSDGPYGPKLEEIQAMVNSSSLIIAFNAKFDLHWLRRYKVRFQHRPVWCLQYAEWIIGGQTHKKYPSLQESCLLRGLEGKSDVVKTEYWDKGIETKDVPWAILEQYCGQDLEQEWQLFWKQVEYLKDKPQLKKLIWWGCQDMLVTQEMEWNGMRYDFELSEKLGNELLAESAGVTARMYEIIGNRSVDFDSPYHLSAVLYGGTAKYKVQEPWTFIYKDGRTKDKVREVTKELHLPRLIEPLKGTESKTEGYWSTDEKILRKLKVYGKAKQIIELLLKRRELEKRVGTYYHGFPKLAKEMQWENSLIHGHLNHCKAQSGRLSSSKPNKQNLEAGMRRCVITRF